MPNDLPTDFAARTFNLLDFLEGRSRGWGMFQDRSGAVKRRFEIEAEGRWVGNTFELNETFFYDDGQTESRVWRIELTDGSNFTGSCADSIGDATGSLSATEARMDYKFRLKLKDRSIDLDFADRFFPIGNDGVLNRTVVKKFGIRVGDVTAFFYREPLGVRRADPAERAAQFAA